MAHSTPQPPSAIRTDDLDSDYDEEEFERFAAERPFKLKEEGNQKYSENQYEEAIQLWMQSVKETLKRSVRTPSAALYENQITCRLNMSMGYLKLGDWVEAKEQAEMVLEQRPTNVKALYRMALALEKLQDWTLCENALENLLVEAKRGDEQSEKKSDETIENDADEYEASRRRLDLAGFNPDEIRKLVNEIRRRLAKDKAVYKQKAKKVFGGIGAKLDQIGASEDRPETTKEAHEDLPDDEGMDDLTLDKGMEDLVGIVDLKNIVRWRYAHPEDEEEIEKMDENEKKGKGTEVNEDVESDEKKEKKNETKAKPTAQQLLSTHATPVLKDYADNDLTSDDPTSQLWMKGHTVETLKEDRRPMTLSLPFTFLRVLEMATAPRKAVSPKDAEDGEVGRELNSPPTLLESDLKDVSKRGRLQRRLVRSLYRHRHLTVHILGVRGDVEMECQWTSVLKRVLKLRTLQIVFIGFQDADDRWSRGLREGVMSPPLTKSQGLSAGKKLTCRLFKGLYQLFLKEYPDVLTRRTHPFYPDLVMIPEPRLARYFDPWFPVFNTLVNHEIPTIVTGYSAVDHATHDAQNLPVILKTINAEWAIPLQPNLYAIKVQPDAELPPMTLWAPPGEEEQEFHGVSAKNAVVGVFFGYSTEPYNLDNIEDLKAQLRPICDVESEEFAVKSLVAEKWAERQEELKQASNEGEGATQESSEQNGSATKQASSDLAAEKEQRRID